MFVFLRMKTEDEIYELANGGQREEEMRKRWKEGTGEEKDMKGGEGGGSIKGRYHEGRRY